MPVNRMNSWLILPIWMIVSLHPSFQLYRGDSCSDLLSALPTPIAVVFDPNPYIENSLKEGHQYFGERKYKEAQISYSHVIETFPHYGVPYAFRGYTYFYLGDLNKALADFNSAIEKGYETEVSLFGRAQTYLWLGKYENALSDYNHVLKINPKSIDAYFGRGRVYLEFGKFDDAIQDETLAICLDEISPYPVIFQAFVFRAQAEFKLENYEDALRDYSAAMGRISRSSNMAEMMAEIAKDRGMTYMKLGRFTQAWFDFTYAMILNPQYEDAYYERSLALLSTGACASGEEDFKEMLKINPNSVFKDDLEVAIARCKSIEEF